MPPALRKYRDFLPARGITSWKGSSKLSLISTDERLLTFLSFGPAGQHIGRKPDKVKREKADTKRVSLDLFLSGKTIEEVAEERGLTSGTVEAHLIHFIETSELDIFRLYPEEKIIAITSFLTESPQLTLGEAKTALGDDFTYSEIRAALKYLRTIDL